MLDVFKKKKSKTSSERIEIIGKDSPFPFNESFSTLRTNLSFVTSANNAKTILITSALPEEGKTSIAINLAITLAKDNKKVLLIDGDLRKPSVQRYLRIRPGSMQVLTSVLTNKVETQEAIGFYELLGIDVMIAGVRPPNPAELIALPKMKSMINELEEIYDHIIVDAPPATVITMQLY